MEKFSQIQVDDFLPKTAVWWKDIILPAAPSKEVVAFSRLSKRKKLLALILLTDPENERLPALLCTSHASCAGTFAWLALDWVLLDKQRVGRLLLNANVNDQARNAIQTAVKAGRCNDKISSILNDPNCIASSLAIAQYGSLKQRISLVEGMSPKDAGVLVCGSKESLISQAIDWARSI
ncbi:MAG: hypothetical protein SFV32_09330 [Opitutaceae bacterium]|nr:hypothetical protein [Opitutaceae bacterium]